MKQNKTSCIFIDEFVIIFFTMRTIKMNVNSLEKNNNIQQSQSANKQLPHKKKSNLERKLNLYQPERIPHQSNHCHPNNYGPHDSIIQNILDAQRQMDTSLNAIQTKKQSKSTVKLPVINSRSVKHTTETENAANQLITNEQFPQNVDSALESKKVSTNQSRKNFRQNLKENKIEDMASTQKVESFLKFIQIKSMKPQEKSPNKPIDLSVRELKVTKAQKQSPMPILPKPIQCQVNKKIKIVRRSSQKSTFQKVQQKQKDKVQIRQKQKQKQKLEKSVNVSYSIKKQKKALSITQPIRKKTSNTYYDFCYYISILNKMSRPSTPSASYRAYVGKGNNSILVKNQLKNRFWWMIVDSDSQVNLHWTQCKDSKFLQNLKSLQKTEGKKSIDKQPKKVQFYLNKEISEKQGQLKEYTGVGLNKLLSREEKKRYGKGFNGVELLLEPNYRKITNPNKCRMHNHLEFHWHISNKKALYYNLKKYYETIEENPFKYIPVTFHIQKQGGKQWMNFQKAFEQKNQDILKKHGQNKNKKKKQKNLWIVKPGENSNQGCGIQVFDNLQEIKEMIKYKEDRANGKNRSFIIQKYLMPFLYNKRKFDIRCYVLVTSINKIMKAYWYQQGYIRTSCKQFTTKNLKNRLIHLTNDAVQKKSEDYGKYENGNKISYHDFQKYLDTAYPEKNYKFFSKTYPQMIKQASDTIKSTCMLMDSNNRQFSFQLFGLDYMIDEEFNTWLIEVNTNPCLQLSSPLLARIIPNMVENALKIAIDPIFPPPRQYPKTKTMSTDLFESNKFTLIFNSSEEEEMLANLTKDVNLQDIIESDEDEENHDEIE